MQIEKQEIEYALDKADEFYGYYKTYCLEADAVVRSVDSLRKLCGQCLSKDIRFYLHPISYLGQPIRGFCLTFEKHYEIIILSGQNYCWQRLVLCKELFQIIIDRECYRTGRIARLIAEATVAFHDPSSSLKMPVASETLAEIAAMEFLFPYRDRVILCKELQQSHKTRDFAVIAEQYKIPRVMVERYLSQPYMSSLGVRVLSNEPG